MVMGVCIWILLLRWIKAVVLLLYSVWKDPNAMVLMTSALSPDSILVSSICTYASYEKSSPLLTLQAPTNRWEATTRWYGICVDTLNNRRYGKVYTAYKRKSSNFCRRE